MFGSPLGRQTVLYAADACYAAALSNEMVNDL